ncbi:mitochondrial solute carrier family 25 (mitochondrial S-adenosylmethionine transporter) member 26 [Andalucia godoyi]|uniref:Mitochondrial solute carrier family 25 (Mitochondrial S-adenosylmethionine transporter) member 26 n=1 Tax=Andalucia godoyi TaxID=505711 RepID=A0A8K0AIY5_ANDGO|nr:mitochondrial solute carrier family 25 (mitochondrial S-adenosylmethionine transporter) member 26 [Andalucia godoyi]|eukprot:ANDGO_06565.mRNA.1 mitochondrial solute carrier family 25 (mitochondrial S-adenosylmethionine transporter) member 26
MEPITSLIPEDSYATAQGDSARQVSQDFLAGVLGGCVAQIITHPLDTVKTRLQTPSFAMRYHSSTVNAMCKIPVRSLFSGLTPLLVGQAPASGLYFAVYELIKTAALMHLPDQCYAPIVHFVAGGIGDVVSSAIIVPTEILKLRMQTYDESNGAKRPRMLQEARSIYATSGIRGLYRGWFATCLRDGPYSAFQFLFYEYLKEWTFSALQAPVNPVRVLHGESRRGAATSEERTPTLGQLIPGWSSLSREAQAAIVALWSGGLAGGAAAALTNPLDVVKTRLQLNTVPVGISHTGKVGIAEMTKLMWRHEGFKSFASGVLPRTVWMTAVTSLTFAFYEASRVYLQGHWLGKT